MRHSYSSAFLGLFNFGAGNAMIEGENPLVGALEGAGTGLVGGAALSGIGGQIVKGVKARQLRKMTAKSRAEKNL